MKKVFTLLFVILAISVLTVGILCIDASAATSGTTGDCTWTLDGTILTISGNGKIGDYSYMGSKVAPWGTSITEVIIEDGVTTIGDYAFYSCKNLVSIAIPDSVIAIGSRVFAYTAWYDAQPDGIVYAGKIAYTYKGTCPSKVTLKGGTLGVAEYAFRDCIELTSIEIPDSVTTIGFGAFYDCTSLNKITLPFVGNTLNGTENTHFGYIFGASYYSYNDSYVPSSLKEVVITKATTIYEYAFDECTSIVSITMPDSVTTIRYHAFRQCTSLTDVYISDLKAWCEIKFFSEMSNPFANAHNLYLNGQKVTSLVIPDNITTLGDYTFFGCDSLTSATIPDGVASIGDHGFNGCTNLISITIPDSVTTIGEGAFARCTNLISITIPDSVTTIGQYAFSACTNLVTITLPFVGNTLNGTENTHFGYIFGAFRELENSSYVPSSLKEVVITKATTIGPDAFYKCSSLASVVIPDTVNEIGNWAFNGCTGLTSIAIPNSVTKISYEAFDGCVSLRDVWYEGLVSDRNRISIGSYNDFITSATWHYNSCMKNPGSEKVHIYTNACDTTCNLCEAEREVPDHTYDDAKDLICNICGHERPPYTPGDLDGKEGVDIDDVVHLLFYLTFPESYPVNQPVDFDGSEAVDLDDVIHLLFHLTFPESYPLH